MADLLMNFSFTDNLIGLTFYGYNESLPSFIRQFFEGLSLFKAKNMRTLYLEKIN